MTRFTGSTDRRWRANVYRFALLSDIAYDSSSSKNEESFALMRQSCRDLDAAPGDAMHLQTVPEPDILPTFAPTREQGLPHSASSATFHNRDLILQWLSQNVPEKRLQHVLRVEEFSVQLAQHHGLDADRAAQAGLMHDLAKYFKPKRLLELAEADGLQIDEVYEANPHLLHADVGAIVARTEFGIQDIEVLDAIRNHTLGSPDMSLLSCVVFLADSLEPGRGETSALVELRRLSWQSLHQAVWQTSEHTLRFLLDSSSLIHPRAVLTRNWALQAAARNAHRHKR